MESSHPPEETIGQKIKRFRNNKDLTQEALARRADIPYATLVKIENPSIKTVKKIASGLDITIDELIS